MSKKNESQEYTLITQDQENATSIKLLQQSFDYMKVALDDIKKSIGELRDEVKNGFVTKEEFFSLKTEVKELQDLKGWGLRIVVGGVIMALLALVLSQK